jgi:hypothetical protein
MINGGSMAEQIYYSHWGSESEEHKNYFEDMATIADWIGYAMIGARTNAFTGEISTLSNITVLQTKEKFGSPRVYVQFSDDNELEDAKHYRFVYQTAIKLWPHYEKSIREGMDYHQYLFETHGEITKHIQDQMKWLLQGRVMGEIDNDFYLEKLERIHRESIFLKKVCDLT